MDSFKEYLASEFKDNANGYAAIDWKFSHTQGFKIDKTTKKTLIKHIITINPKFYDKDLNLLFSANIKFVNNELDKSTAKKLVNIAPAELTNKFNFVRKEICKLIIKELKDKETSLQNKVKAVLDYVGEDDSIAINGEFKGELIKVVNDPVVEKKNKMYEM